MSRPLTDRFLQTIDAAAMRSGDTDTDDYLDQWKPTEWKPIEGDPAQFLDDLVAKIEAEYTGKRLSNLVKNGGWEPSETG